VNPGWSQYTPDSSSQTMNLSVFPVGSVFLMSSSEFGTNVFTPGITGGLIHSTSGSGSEFTDCWFLNNYRSFSKAGMNNPLVGSVLYWYVLDDSVIEFLLLRPPLVCLRNALGWQCKIRYSLRSLESTVATLICLLDLSVLSCVVQLLCILDTVLLSDVLLQVKLARF
jgi:hypothetical protein